MSAPAAGAETVDGSALVPRDIRRADLDAVVRLHQACFPDYFLTSLGPRVLHGFYEVAVDDPETVAAVMEEPASGHILGVAIGTLNPAFHTNLFRSHLLRFAAGLAVGLITQPAVRRGMRERMGFIGKLFRAKADDTLSRAGIAPPNGREARFLDVAVHPSVRGGRTAERLVEYFAGRVFETGAARVGGSVKPQNLGSLILYKRLGWNVQKTGPDRVDVWTDR